MEFLETEEKQRGSLPRIPMHFSNHLRSAERIWNILGMAADAKSILLDEQAKKEIDRYNDNVENFIGTVKIPVGVAGPLRLIGSNGDREYYVPFATTEAALVASYSRGMRLITESGGCRAAVLAEGVSRAPVFQMKDLGAALQFVRWCEGHFEIFREIAQTTTRHGKLQNIKISQAGNTVFVAFEYTTGDASGQNMISIATDAVFRYIQSHSPVAIEKCFIEGNFSGDKKATHRSLQSVRGKKVTVETTISQNLLKQRMGLTVDEILECQSLGILGSLLSGMMGGNFAHISNALAAIFIACGQDPACVSEAAVGFSMGQKDPFGDLYVSLTMPNLIVGTVGGGTGLPSQNACLQLMGLKGEGKAKEFAEVVAGVALAGEISLVAAVCTKDFVEAHEILRRKRQREAN